MNKWLDARLKELPGKSKSGLARELGLSHARVFEIVKGTRRIQTTEIPVIAQYLEWPEEQVFALASGQPHGLRPASVAVAGYVGAGAAVFAIDDHAKGGGIDMLELPTPGDVVAVRVRGDSQMPVYRDGDTILYSLDQRVAPSSLLGVECVVKLAEPDGRTLIKILRRGATPRHFTLASHNANDIEDVAVEWAAPVLWVKRGL